MKTIKFKTNIKCSGCIETVSPALNKTAGENNCSVDLADASKTLTVTSENADAPAIIEAMKHAGYSAELKK